MRNFRLRERRERLGLSQRQLAVIAVTAEITGLYRFGQSHVSLAETKPRANPRYTEVCRRTLVKLELEERHKRYMERINLEYQKEEEERVAFQRSLWAALPDHPAVRALKAAMLDRCLDLMSNNRGEETDALAEFLPEADVDAMFRQWDLEAFGAPLSPAVAEPADTTPGHESPPVGPGRAP